MNDFENQNPKGSGLPKEKRVVPITANAAGANADELTYRKCKYTKKQTCYGVQCDYSKS